jgi:hypothetical protein
MSPTRRLPSGRLLPGRLASGRLLPGRLPSGRLLPRRCQPRAFAPTLFWVGASKAAGSDNFPALSTARQPGVVLS